MTTTIERILADAATERLRMLNEGIDHHTGGVKSNWVTWSYGPPTYLICEDCSYGGHGACPGCGGDATHAHPVCAECLREVEEGLR